MRDTAEYSSAHNAHMSVFVPLQFSAASILIATTAAVTSTSAFFLSFFDRTGAKVHQTQVSPTPPCVNTI
jgi:hypothetical protein